MPLNTSVVRNGEPRTDIVWDYFALSCMYTSAIKEGAPKRKGLLVSDPDKAFGDLKDGEYIDFSMCPIYYLEIPGVALLSRGRQILKQRHVYYRDKERKEQLVFEAGDVLIAYRSYK